MSSLLLLAASLTASDDFPLGVWYEGGAGEFRHNLIPIDPKQAEPLYLANFKDIAAHGCNIAVAPNTTPDHFSSLLDSAQKAGIKLILELGHEGGPIGEAVRKGGTPKTDALRAAFEERLKPIQNHPALARVQLLDEPWKEVMPTYAAVARELKRFNPKMPPFTCIIEADHVTKFLSETHSDVVAFDCYPLGVNTPVGDEKALKRFEDVAFKAAAGAGFYTADAWAVIQCHAITGSLRYPTPAELRRMTHTALAAGCKGIFWFLYQTEWLDPKKGIEMGGLVDGKYQPRALWDEVGRLTAQIRKIAPVLEELEAEGARNTCSDGLDSVFFGEGGLYVYLVNPDVFKVRTLNVSVFPEFLRNGFTLVPAAGGDAIPAVKTGEKFNAKVHLEAGDGGLFKVEFNR
ncbi:MAG: hypothetical protein HZC36_02920 [Armatimonadetes bacterium]|nr:hypothetical protein [Armatimonadota bacterium]